MCFQWSITSCQNQFNLVWGRNNYGRILFTGWWTQGKRPKKCERRFLSINLRLSLCFRPGRDEHSIVSVQPHPPESPAWKRRGWTFPTYLILLPTFLLSTLIFVVLFGGSVEWWHKDFNLLSKKTHNGQQQIVFSYFGYCLEPWAGAWYENLTVGLVRIQIFPRLSI